ncbi:hypothetical protein [Pseudomonas aeruginosa]|uniref:hypothetical protein n=1 Tax=Pseudomonas aeruginosa TaxID=287 RepID=UPI0038B8BBBD
MSKELTDVRCSCSDEYPADSYDAGFIAGSGMCQNCDAAIPPKNLPAPVEQAGGDERAADEKPRATRCPDCGEHDLMPGDLCACGYETDPATGYACSECDGSGEGCVGEVCRECDGSGWFVTPDQARAALAQPSPAQAEQHWPKLEKPAQVGGVRFSAGVSSRLVVEAAQRLYEFESTPEQEAERIERLQAFREQCFEPLGAEFSKVLSDNLPELLSTAQAEQAEAERPEVVARVVHSNPVVLGQCGPLNANDELMTVAQHAASVARWAEMFNRVEQQRDALEAEAQALREEVAALRMARDDFKLERDLARQNFCDEQAANYQLQAHFKSCLGELSELRARVVVLPDASTVYAALDARERLFTSPENIQVALEAQSRLNGKTVSEALLREVARHLGNWLELHECECDGGFHYCGRDQVAKTNRELRALLNEDKENGNG